MKPIRTVHLALILAVGLGWAGPFAHPAAAQQPTILQAPTDQTVCLGSLVVFEARADFAFATGATLTWQFDDGTGFADLADGDRAGRISITEDLTDPSDALSILTISGAGDASDAGRYRIIAASDGGSASAEAALAFFPPAGVNPTAQLDALCAGRSVALSADPTGSDPANQRVVWSVVSGPNLSGLQFAPSPAVADPLFTPTASGTYTLRAETIDCGAAASADLMLDVFDGLAVSPTAAADTACIDQPVALAAGVTGGSDSLRSVQWSVVTAPPSSTPVFSPDADRPAPDFSADLPGVYELSVVATQPGCDDSAPATRSITVTDSLTVDATSVESELCLGGDTLLNATSADPGTVTWSIESGPDLSPTQWSNHTARTTRFTPAAAGTFVLRSTLSNGVCPDGVDDVTLLVHPAPTADISEAPTQVCVDDAVPLSLTTAGSGPSNQSILWRVEAGPNLSANQFSTTSDRDTVFTPTDPTDPTGQTDYTIAADVADFICDELITGRIDLTVLPKVDAAPTASAMVGCQATPLTLAANATGGSEAFRYEWAIASGPTHLLQFDDPTIATPTFTPAQGPADYQLSLVVTDPICPSAQPVYLLPLTVVARLTVDPTIEFDATVIGEPVSLRATPAGGVNRAYQWNVASKPPGCTDAQPISDPTIESPTFTPACTGRYVLTISVTDDVCKTVVGSLTVDVLAAKVEAVADPPAVALCNAGAVAQLTASVPAAPGPFDFQWKIADGPDIADSQLINPASATPILLPTTAGTYRLSVTATSIDGTLPPITTELLIPVVDTAPNIAPEGQPTATTACLGQSVTLSVVASGPELAYQWQRDGADLPGRTEPTLTIASVDTTSSGSYTCTVSNVCGSVVSDAATLTVNVAAPSGLIAATRDEVRIRTMRLDDCDYTGVADPRIDLSAELARITGLAVQPATGTLYASVRPTGGSTETWLATIDPTNAALTLIGSMGEPISDLAFRADGTLFAVRGRAAPVGAYTRGEIVTVEIATGAIAHLDPVLSFGNVSGQSIVFDDQDRLLHHGRQDNVASHLNRVTLSNDPGVDHAIELVKAYPAPFPEWRAMVFDANGRLLAATQDLQLWAVDPDNGFARTVLGQTVSETGSPIRITGLAFVAAPTLTLQTELDATTAGIGQDLTYRITVTNVGDSLAESIDLTDSAPAGTTFVSAAFLTGTGVLDVPDPCDACQITWRFDAPLAPQQSYSVELVVTPDPDLPDKTRIEHTGATASAPGVGTVTAAPSSIDFRRPDLTATMTARVVGSGIVEPLPGDRIRFDIHLANTGLDAAQVRIFVNAGLDLAIVPGSATTSAGTIDAQDPLDIRVDVLAEGASIDASFEANVLSGVPGTEICVQGVAEHSLGLAALTDDPWKPGTRDPTCLRRCRSADADCDGRIDSSDYGAFSPCVGSSPLSVPCERFDVDLDGDVDLPDFAAFQRSFGPDQPG